MPIRDIEKRREVHKRYMREVWYPRNRAKHIALVKRRKDLSRALTKQVGNCPICLRDKQHLFRDHCHKTELVRGWICQSCNFVLGHAYDNKETLFRAIQYLKAAEITAVS